MKKAYIYINYPNIVVLKMYLDIVKNSLENLGYSCAYTDTLDGVGKKELIVFPMGNDAFKYYVKGFHNIVMWQQGVTAEESYMRHHSSIRRKILNFFDGFSMKHAKYVFFVSEALREYYENIIKHSLADKSYIMPCFNETFDRSRLEYKNYNKKTFAYVGSLSVWQCFDETLEFYKQIEQRFDDTELLVLTFEVDKAIECLQKSGIKKYKVKSVPQEQVKEELSDISYGFILRKDIIVNQVATPTKISSYLAAGVLPIFSDCLRDFNRISDGLNIGMAVGSDICQSMDEVTSYIASNKNTENIIENIEKIFNTYYSIDYHTERITDELKRVLK